MKYVKVHMDARETKVGSKRYRVDMVDREDGIFYEYMMWLVVPKVQSIYTVYGELNAEEYSDRHEEMLDSLWEMVKKNARVTE